jgi:ribonuclease E
MKENTGALHCQVPVDVATFLLNEKRADISRIEIRHRANLVIVPNRHLETPAHEIIRLRHDQLNAEGLTVASYQMAEKPVEEAYQPPSTQADVKPAKIEAAVKGITPDQPAPIVESKPIAPVAPPAPVSERGLWARIVAFFMGTDPVVAPVPSESKADRSPRRDGGRERNRDGNRETGRSGRDRGPRRDGRDNRDGSERKERGEQPARSQPKRDEPQGESGNRRPRDSNRSEPREPKEAREAREPREPRPPREPKEPREPREPRPPRSELPVTQGAASPQATLPRASVDSENGQGSNKDGEARSGRRSRGRGRGRGRSEESGAAEVTSPEFAATPAAEAANFAPEIPAVQPASMPAVETVAATAPDMIPDQARTTEAAPVEDARPVPAPAPEAAPVFTTAVTVAEPIPLPVVVPPPVAAAEPAPQVAAAPVEPVTPAPAADPIIVPAAPKPAPPDISGSLQQAGLVMIETNHAASSPAMVHDQAPPLGRKPRPAPVIVSEPLQMVETKNN